MNPRYIIRKRVLSFQEAHARKQKDIEYARAKLKEAHEELVEEINRPPCMEHQWQEEVWPDHPDYGIASIAYNAALYQGDFEWKTTPTPQTQTPSSPESR